ncbi:translation initiation factor eIF-2B subunit gamma [Macrosteles quadrilineatus]|uniref:translation initiation factor eIF-2B subunit gamma n=1 Tax=Macrosteles quadrilineatus TaxID=74068 RepID=UPI0023E28BAC|nr:translation initiation factor eIF-2B subunit gamma [Macrosteles quadrilineatus]XP_054284733.1 translation initiation factor eIF-2B subunit gamma [Macrosteles quadrilineatus]
MPKDNHRRIQGIKMNSEFQAIIMAGGKGSRMTELTSKRSKCLLPIGNLPMIWYPLRLLEKSGFREAIVVVTEQIKNDVQVALDRTGLKIHTDIVGIPGGEDWGTADTLRHLEDSNKIKSDVVIVSCDLITDVDLSVVINRFRQHEASLATLFFQPTPATVILPTPGPKSKNKTERDLVAIDPATSRLVFLASASDYEETLELSRGLLKKHGKVQLYSKLLDAHVYVMRRWLTKYLSHNRNMSTLKGELIPYTVKKQFSRPPSAKHDHEKAASVVYSFPKTELIDMAEEEKLASKVRSMSSYSDHRGDQRPAYHGDLIRCYAHIASEQNFATRANTLQEYCRINREIVDRWTAITGEVELVSVAPSAVVASSQLERESCLVGEKAVVAERTSVKASILGPHSIIKPRTRVLNSVLMSGSQVGEGCVIVNCVLCADAVVEDSCDLKDCLVGSHIVSAGEKHSNEVLTDDHLIEIV